MTDCMPKLVMGCIVVMTPDGEEGIPYDEAVIHLEGDEDSEIEIHCPNAPKLAETIVNAVNSHDARASDLAEAVRLLDALLGLEKGSGQAALAFVERHNGAVGTGKQP